MKRDRKKERKEEGRWEKVNDEENRCAGPPTAASVTKHTQRMQST